MRTQVIRTAAFGAFVGAALLLTFGSAAQAQTVASDRGAGFIVFPKILSDTSDAFNRGQTIDTVVQLTNNDPNNPHFVHCFYVNGTGTCDSGENAIGGLDCLEDDDCGEDGRCVFDDWGEDNFTLILTQRQPTGWLVSEGRDITFIENDPNAPGAGDGVVRPAPRDFFLGELKCIEVADGVNFLPINRNDLKGEASIYTVTRGLLDPNEPNAPEIVTSVDVRRYNAIGIQTTASTPPTQNDRTLCLGGNGISGNVCEFAEYASCPEKLIVNHLFASGDVEEGPFTIPSVTLVPCTERLTTEVPTNLTIQVLVFNEFEQRFSLSTEIECIADIVLPDLSGLYEIGTQGTVAGQSIFRAVADSSKEDGGFGLLGIAEQFTDRGSTAYNVVYSSSHEAVADFVTYVGIPTD